MGAIKNVYGLILRQMNRLCINILAEAILYKEFYKRGATEASPQRPALLKEVRK